MEGKGKRKSILAVFNQVLYLPARMGRDRHQKCQAAGVMGDMASESWGQVRLRLSCLSGVLQEAVIATL